MLVIDARYGVAGDMLLSALVDAGADGGEIAKAVAKWGKVRFEKIERAGVRATIARIRTNDGKYETHEKMEREIEGAKLSQKWKGWALAVAKTIADAEEKVHGHVHFEELAEADTLVDIVGVAKAFELLGEGAVVLQIGIGKPGPATLVMLKGREVIGRNAEHELTTPTGAGLVTNLEQVSAFPEMRIGGVGYGAGNAILPLPNYVRVVRGEIVKGKGNMARAGGRGKTSGAGCDCAEEVSVLETNVDDVDGEIIAYAAERLIEEGARDASIQPYFGKKGRPGFVLQAVCAEEDAKRLVRVIFEETGSLGVREYTCRKYCLPREIRERKTKFGKVRVKIARDCKGELMREKIEYEDARKIAKKFKIPLRKALCEIKRELKK